MLVRHRRMFDATRAAICTVLAVLLAVTPLGSLAHLRNAGPDFGLDLCSAADRVGAGATPTQSGPQPDAHVHCGDCSTCGIGFVRQVAPGVSAILIVAVRLDTVVATAPVKSLVGGIVARPRGPPPLA